jgi:oligopeptide/dipeptide ABC transporter ATP-binding protein
MYLGKLMEVSPGETLYSKPIHPYTSALLGAIPIPDPEENRARPRPLLTGEPPSPIRPPPGCRFHLAACHHPQNVTPDEVAAAVRSDASPLSAGQEMPGAADASERNAEASPGKAPSPSD